MTNEPHTARSPRKGEIVELHVSDVGERDSCFGLLDDGRAVFVRGPVAVGDRVRVELLRVKRKHAQARLLEVLTPSTQRVEPACSHFGVCGGCKWQHVNYAEQLRLKHKMLHDALVHIGGFAGPEVCDPVPAPAPFHYRNKIEFSFANRRYLLTDELGRPNETLCKPLDFALGFHAPRSFDKVVDIDRCHLATDEMNTVLQSAREFALARSLSVYSTRTHEGFLRHVVVRQAEATGEVMVNLVTSTYEEELMAELGETLHAALGGGLTTMVNNVTDRKNNAAIGDREYLVGGEGFITERLHGLTFRLSANSFFQTNSRQAERLYDLALEQAGLRPGDTLYDLYSGIGTIALLAAGRCARVLGIEMVPDAVRDAEANAVRNHLPQASFRQLDLKDIKQIRPALAEFGSPDVVMVDPPRAGLHPKVVRTLLELAPRRVVYVSCNPASLARDAAALTAEGAYRMGPVTPVDMFPHTNHIESVVTFDRVS